MKTVLTKELNDTQMEEKNDPNNLPLPQSQ